VPTIVNSTPSIPVQVPFPAISIAAGPFTTGAADSSLELVSAVESSCGNGLSRLEFRRPYGKVMLPFQGDFVQSSDQLGLVGKWASLLLLGPGGSTSVLVHAKVTTESKTVHGHSATTGPTGVQQWTAFGPFQLLLKSTVSGSFWVQSGGATAIENDIPRTFNLKDDLGMIVGNRSSAEVGGTYVFGGDSVWTRRQALDYVLTRYSGSAFGGADWTVSGDTALLDVAADVIEVGSGDSVGSVARSIIAPQFGLDFHIVRAAATFEIRVFSLAANGSSYLGVELPKNSRRITLAAGDRVEFVRTLVERTTDQRYSKLTVRGARIIACFSLRADNGTLVKKWSSSAETTYKAGTGTAADQPGDHDEARTSPGVDNVFSLFGAPDTFTLAGAAAAIGIDDDGAISTHYALHQNTRRSTLSFIPLRENIDYTEATPVDGSPGDHQPDFLRPLIWIKDESGRYRRVEYLGVGASVTSTDWGFRISSNPAHALAKNHWSGANGTEHLPEFDWETLVATVAVELDTRLALTQTRDDGDGTSMEIDAPGAELWVLAPGTVIGTRASDRALVKRLGVAELRNDRDSLAPIMAAAMARYFEERSRANVAIKGLHPWSPLLGDMLSAIQQGGLNTSIGSPITSVVYVGGKNPETIVRAGYAR